MTTETARLSVLYLIAALPILLLTGVYLVLLFVTNQLGHFILWASK